MSSVAVALHVGENFTGGVALHRNTLLFTAIGFAVLTVIGRLLPWRGASRSAGAMALFLLALSFSHFSQEEAHAGWLIEVIIHHAGLPLALFVLMQDYRFVLLDAFLRFLANILLASLFALAGLRAAAWGGWFDWRSADPRALSLAVVAAAASLVLFAVLRHGLQSMLTRLLFRPRKSEVLLARLRGAIVETEARYLEWAAGQIAGFFDAEARLDASAAEVEIVVPVRLAEGESPGFGLTRRGGGRRYLSEDHDLMAAFAAEISARVEHFREDELRRLVSHAELRALQSQIHPHFLFNALNTLYGIIPREARGARETVLNLADIFRYFLRTDRQTIPLEEEMRIVRAYLAIESLRLGDKLAVSLDVDESLARTPIPVLSIQPLVENAIKHAIAPNPDGGRLTVRAKAASGWLDVSVEDTGPGIGMAAEGGAGIALDNVRKRLQICFGGQARLAVDTTPQGTIAALRLPLEAAP